jgi:hypothetical protein
MEIAKQQEHFQMLPFRQPPPQLFQILKDPFS